MRILFWATYVVWIGGEIGLVLRELGKPSGANLDRGSRRFVAIVIMISIVAAFLLRAYAPAARIAPATLPLIGGGLVLMWLGMALRYWSVWSLGRHFRTTVVLQDGHELVQCGPYRLLRNPSYSGSLLTFAGLGLVLDNWLSLALLIAGPLTGFVRRIRIEDATLAAHFGQRYAAYRAHTWSLVPGLW
jgi:protein-S-isoprenylcysteine O-methyltransferase